MSFFLNLNRNLNLLPRLPPLKVGRALEARRAAFPWPSAAQSQSPNRNADLDCFSIYSDARRMRQEADVLDKLEETARLILNTRTKRPDLVDSWLQPGKDTGFDADAAVRAGLADEVIEPPPAIVHAPKSPLIDFTEDDGSEKLIRTFLSAVGPVKVADKAAFGAWLNTWFVHQVTELPKRAKED